VRACVAAAIVSQVKMAGTYRQLKAFLIQLVLGWLQHKVG
jgi:hypothetical protein